jgi:hypothetical protein
VGLCLVAEIFLGSLRGAARRATVSARGVAIGPMEAGYHFLYVRILATRVRGASNSEENSDKGYKELRMICSPPLGGGER